MMDDRNVRRFDVDGGQAEQPFPARQQVTQRIADSDATCLEDRFACGIANPNVARDDLRCANSEIAGRDVVAESAGRGTDDPQRRRIAEYKGPGDGHADDEQDRECR